MFVPLYVQHYKNDEYLPLSHQDPSCFKTEEERSGKDARGRHETRNWTKLLEKSKDNMSLVCYCQEMVFGTLQHHYLEVKLSLEQ